MMEQIQQTQQVADQAGLLAYIASVGILGAVSMGAAEGAGRMLKTMERFRGSKRVKLATASIVGPAAAMVAYGAGFLPTPVDNVFAWAFAGVMGFAGTLAAKGTTDLINKVRGS